MLKALWVVPSVILACGLLAQEPPKTDSKADAAKPAPAEKSSVTEHTIQIGGQTIAYTATAGTILLKDDKGEPTASFFYTAYTRSGAGDAGIRPLTFIYNGGPGGSSAQTAMERIGERAGAQAAR